MRKVVRKSAILGQISFRCGLVSTFLVKIVFFVVFGIFHFRKNDQKNTKIRHGLTGNLLFIKKMTTFQKKHKICENWCFLAKIDFFENRLFRFYQMWCGMTSGIFGNPEKHDFREFCVFRDFWPFLTIFDQNFPIFF